MKKERLFLALLGLIVLMVVILSISLGWRPAFDMIRYTGAVTWNDNGSAVQDVNGCGTFNTANAVYTLNQSLSATSSCFSITATNVTLDCQGFWINGSKVNGQRAIENLGYDNTTIRNCNIRDFGADSGGGCFLSGTEITMADGSYKNIEDIEVGDSVISYDEPTGKEIITQVKKKFIHDSSEFSRHYLIINNKLKVTPNHPLYVNGQWKEAGKVKKGDYLLDEKGNQILVNNIKEVSEDVPVYNIEVSGKTIDLCGPGHNYYADGILVHNKPCAFLFSKEDEKTELEWHIFGVYDETGDYNSALLDLRNIKEKQGYSYLNLVHETNKFELVELPYEIDFIDFIELKVVDTPVYPFNLILKEKVYHLKLVDASQGLELMQEPDEQYFNLTSTQRISITFEELPEKNTFYKRNLVFVAKGWYEFYQGATLLGDWLYEEPYKDEKMINHFEQKDRRDEIVQIYRTTIEKMGGREGILPYPYEEEYTSSKQNSGNSGIHIENSNYHLIENVVIANSVLIYESGIYFSNVTYSNISDVSISKVYDEEMMGNGASGIELTSDSNYNLLANINVSNNFKGISLDSSSNNNLTSITANLNNIGIFLESSSNNNTLTNNTANSNTVGYDPTGIYLTGSDNNNLTNNTANLNDRYGIYLYSSDNNNLTNNTANLNSQYAYGIKLDSSNSNTLIGNTLNSNGGSGVYLADSSDNTLKSTNMSNNGRNFEITGDSNSHLNQDIDSSNIVDYNKKIYYNYSISDYVFDSSNCLDAGMVLCAVCDNVTIKDLSLTAENNSAGVYFFNTTNSRIENVDASLSNRYGIYLGYYSNNNNITNNIVNSNNMGIYLGYYSNNNNITNNTANSNHNYGIEIYYSSNNNIINNILNSNGNGVDLDNSNTNTITNNTANLNYNYGFYLRYSSNNNLTNNTANSNDHVGINVNMNSDNNNLTNNTGNSNGDYGIQVYYADSNTLINNTANSNDRYGIYLYNSENNNLKNTNMSNNTANFYITGSSNSHFNQTIDSSNIVDYNKKIYYNYSISNYIFDLTTAPDAGMVLCVACDNITIKDLNLNARNFAGVYFYSTSNSRIENVSANSNNNAIYMYGSKNNRIINLTSLNCSSGANYAGIYIKRSSGNYFENIYLNNAASSARGIHIFGDSSTASLNSSNNLFKHVTIENMAGNDVYIQRTSGEVLNNTFINSTYSTSKEVVSGANTELIRKWYLDVVVNAQNANVTGFNVSDVELFSELTNVSGIIERKELIEYSNLNSVRTYATPHIINTAKLGYVANSTTYDLTLEQNVNHLVTLVVVVVPPSLGGESSGTIVLSQEEIEEGYSKLFREDQKVRLTINEQIHTVVINSVDNENKKIEVELEEIGEVIELSENETKKIDLNNDGYYDLQISVNEIGVNNYADLEFKEIHEEVPAEEQEEQESPSKIEKEIKDWMWIVGCLIGLIVVGVVVRRVIVRNKGESTYE